MELPRHGLPDPADRLVLPVHDEQPARRRRTRDAVRQVQGQGRQQGHPEDDVRRRRRLSTRRSRSSHEIKEFLQQPAKFQAVGAKIPKGVLLYGPPGTGKTLLARAVAGEANVPFYSISGSDFVEMFVGVGASRVRDLFEQAKENAPAIVFIDEIDAVGRHRGAGMGGGHDEREQTLNQLLVEMDGFDVRGGVILIAATNRPDVLDPALLRPGRFDRMVGVSAPNMDGRHKILKVHSRGKPIASGVDLLAVARRTPGFTGADLANVLNEAALLTARKDKKLIDEKMLDEAIDRVSMGPQRHSHLMSEQEKLMTAYHEGGHALVAAALPGTDPVTKITILPRGRALGLHPGAARGRQVVGLAQRAAQPARLRPRRSRGRAADLPRPDHGLVQRHREGDEGRPRDGHELRHERASRRGEARRGEQRAVPRPRLRAHPQLLRGDRGDHRRGGQQAPDERPPGGVRHPGPEPPRARQPRHRAAREGDDRPQGAGRRLRRRRRCVRSGRPGPARTPASRPRIPPVAVPASANGVRPEPSAEITVGPGSETPGPGFGEVRPPVRPDRLRPDRRSVRPWARRTEGSDT